MSKFPIMHARSPQLSSTDIAARLTEFLTAMRQQRRMKAQAEAGELASIKSDGPDDDPYVVPKDTRAVFLSNADRQAIERRAGRLHKRQITAGGLGHLNREERERLSSLDSGVGMVQIPDEHRADELAAAVHAEMPWMAAATEHAWHAMRRSVREGHAGFRLPPVILDGTPGIGKSRWAMRLGQLIGAQSTIVDATGESASFGVVGCQRGWTGAGPGRLLELILAKMSGNPILVIDELEKAGKVVSSRGSPFGLAEGLLPLLERDTAANWTCPFYRVRFNMSWVSWILLTNNVALLPDPLLSRCTIIRLKEVPLADLMRFAEREGQVRTAVRN